MRALIVEDNLTNRQLLLKLLSPFGEIEVAADGKEAVEIFHKTLASGERYSLICMDIMMPEIDGYEALAQIRQLEEENGIAPEDAAKVIMTTAVDSPSSVEEAKSLRCNGYLIKPIRKIKLIEELQRLELIPSDVLG
jgi:two-component system chemotaxis response regulator CheY